MPNCPTCGSPVSENDRFCSKCGAMLIPPPPKQRFLRFPAKPTTNFGNGAFIGAGVTLVIVGLFLTLALNAIYWQQTQLIINDLPIITVKNMTFLIATGPFIAVMGAYLLIWGGLNQFSVTFRAALGRRDVIARLGAGCISGGFVLVDLAVLQSVNNWYYTQRSSLVIVHLIFLTAGFVSMLIGALLIRSSYLRSRRLATKA